MKQPKRIHCTAEDHARARTGGAIGAPHESASHALRRGGLARPAQSTAGRASVPFTASGSTVSGGTRRPTAASARAGSPSDMSRRPLPGSTSPQIARCRPARACPCPSREKTACLHAKQAGLPLPQKGHRAARDARGVSHRT